MEGKKETWRTEEVAHLLKPHGLSGMVTVKEGKETGGKGWGLWPDYAMEWHHSWIGLFKAPILALLK